MALSIISLSQSEFIARSAEIPRGDASLTLSFESEQEVLRAKHALYISKFHPEVFKIFPEFSHYDPTLNLPTKVREKAVRLVSRNLLSDEKDDVIGVVSSLYSDEGEFHGSLVSVGYAVPATHAFMLYTLLSSSKFRVHIKYDETMQHVHVDLFIKGVNMGFWFPFSLNQIQTHDLKQALSGTGYLGLTLPISSKAYDRFMDKNASDERTRLADDFFEKQIVNDWLVFHLAGEKVIRQSAQLNKKALSPAILSMVGRESMTTQEWLTTAHV